MRVAKTAILMVALIGVFFAGISAQAADTSKPVAIPERVLGSPDAPVTVQEFVSMTCSHCAQFYNDVLPELKAKYVDTGKVKFIMRDFPLDGIALRASAVARCMPAEQFYPFVTVLFKTQDKWAFGGNPSQAIVQYAKLGGLDGDKAQACIEDPAMLDAIANMRETYKDQFKIDATPSFVINDNETLKGAVPAADFASVFDRLLAEAKK